MLKETYLANITKIKFPDLRVRVARPSELAPSRELLADWKNKRISWSEFEARFRKQILSDPEAVDSMRKIKWLATKTDVYLYCYEKHPPCHRFILIDLIRGLT